MTCPVDGRPLSNNATICPGCTETLDRALGDIDALLEDLDTALARQSKKRPARGNHPRDDKPLPYDLGASRAASELKAVLVGWARLVSEERGVPLTCRDTSQSISAWLMHHVHWLSRHDAAPDAYSEIVGAVNNIRRTIDIAPDTTYIGPCYAVVEGVECTETLWGIEGTDAATCRTCGTVWDAKARTLEALTHADKVAQTITVMTRSFAVKGIALDTRRLGKWVSRGYLHPHGTGDRNRPTYIVAHVARLVTLYNAGQKLTPWNTEQDTPA
ncbi:hypothetical protein ACFFGR_09345 [Arthrobacter liuii]|uniref:Uncharacterized protein n=1 Tax=Arthrobacter liuii TaxID=1476996 RepID=A0ABQ2AQ28_9MICC|nr:hypothetical protein [Arthrobacter liuii]GGH93847.1 hypothetical protein GCM10007170_15670 [Arthrobacter liuii]